MTENGGADGLLKDFDILAPPRRVARLGGEDIDVTILPARVALRFIGFSTRYGGQDLDPTKADALAPEMLEEMTDIISLVCRKSNQKFTKDWLLDNVELPVLIQFITYVFAPVGERMNALGLGSGGDQGTGQGETEKN